MLNNKILVPSDDAGLSRNAIKVVDTCAISRLNGHLQRYWFRSSPTTFGVLVAGRPYAYTFGLPMGGLDQ